MGPAWLLPPPWRGIQLVGRGRASGREWGRRQRRPKAGPLGQMLTQLRAPDPRGARGSSDSSTSPGIPAEMRGRDSPTPALVPEAGVKGGTRGCQDRVGDSPSEALGGVGGRGWEQTLFAATAFSVLKLFQHPVGQNTLYQSGHLPATQPPPHPWPQKGCTVYQLPDGTPRRRLSLFSLTSPLHLDAGCQ